MSMFLNRIKDDWWAVIIGLFLIAIVAVGAVSHISFPQTATSKLIEYPIWAVSIGLLLNIILSLTGRKESIRPLLKTEIFLKTGLVLLGASVSLPTIMSVGARGLLQAAIMITCVFGFTWWLAGKFKLPPTLQAVMASAVSICGVSAAIAAAGAVLAKKEELTYTTALVIFTALPLMVIMPWLALTWGLPPLWAGAWFGSNIDTTAAVVGAGTIYGQEAMKIASIVKLSQNALIGVVAFLLAVYFAVKVEKGENGKPSPKLIWDRFPKFVFGFLITSILASMGLFSKAQLADIKSLQSWALSLAFVCIGLEVSVGRFKEMGSRPVIVYLCATVFNTTLALLVSWLIFA